MWQYIQTPDPDELYHSWTKRAHKYISRAWKKGKWVYKYPLTGKGYKENAKRESDKYNSKYLSPNRRDWETVDKADAKARQYEYDYYTKSLAGTLKSAFSKKERKNRDKALKEAVKSKNFYTTQYTNLLGNHKNVAKVKKMKLSDIAKKLSKKG